MERWRDLRGFRNEEKTLKMIFRIFLFSWTKKKKSPVEKFPKLEAIP